ncbi:MAG: hypothetical protein ABIR37_00660 [Candidatus Saccharimonadales bacterium]
MTEFSNEQSELGKLLGEVCEKQELPKELQADPGLVSVQIEGDDFCPLAQFVPEKDTLELYPYLSQSWALAREIYGEKDADAISTFTAFVTPQERWAGSTWWDVAVSDEAATAWSRLKPEIETTFRELNSGN